MAPLNSKLLIAQVLGRGLRIPQNLKEAIGSENIYLKVKINKQNHDFMINLIDI